LKFTQARGRAYPDLLVVKVQLLVAHGSNLGPFRRLSQVIMRTTAKKGEERMGRNQCTLSANRHARIWKLLSIFLPLLAFGHTGHSYAAAIYTLPGVNSADVTFSAVPASGSYFGTTVITQMTQTGDALGSFPNSNSFTLSGTHPIAMRADFNSSLSFVSVNFVANDVDTGVLQAYSADGILLGEQVGRDSGGFVLSLDSSSTPFAYILATFADSGGIGEIGYEVATLAAVPEPETYALMLVGLVWLGLWFPYGSRP
jgi:hypothetical protein